MNEGMIAESIFWLITASVIKLHKMYSI